MPKLLLKLLPDLIAAVCGLLFFPWILGAPGHPSLLVELGWTIGIVTIVFYLVTYQIVKSSDRIGVLNRPAIRTLLDRLLLIVAFGLVPVIVIAVLLIVCS